MDNETQLVSGFFFEFLGEYVRRQKGFSASELLEPLKEKYRITSNPKMDWYSFDEFTGYINDIIGLFPNEDSEKKAKSIGVFFYRTKYGVRSKTIQEVFEKEITLWDKRHPGSELEIVLVDKSPIITDIQDIEIMTYAKNRRNIKVYENLLEGYYSALFTDISDDNCAKITAESELKEDYVFLTELKIKKAFLGQEILEKLSKQKTAEKLLEFNLDDVSKKNCGREPTENLKAAILQKNLTIMSDLCGQKKEIRVPEEIILN